MRIGKVILDTDNMSYEEVDILIRELRAIRERKRVERDLMASFANTIAKAKEEGFTFIEKHFGSVIEAGDYMLYDDRAGQN